MASIDFSDDSSDSNFTQSSMPEPESPLASVDIYERLSEERTCPCSETNKNIINKLNSRQVRDLTSNRRGLLNQCFWIFSCMEGWPEILNLRLKDCLMMFIINVGLDWIRLYRY